MVALVLAEAAIENFGGDSLEEMISNWKSFSDRTTHRFTKA